MVVDEPWYLCNDLLNAGEFRRAITFSGTTVTFGDAFTNSVLTATSVDSYPYPPNLYTEATNLAVSYAYQDGYGIWVPRTGLIIPNGGYYGTPRGMRHAAHIEQLGPRVLKELFNVANSTTSAPGGWTAASGDTWGVTSELLYSVTDANNDRITRSEKLKNGVIIFRATGTMESSTVYRTVALMFRHAEDYAGDLDTNNYLLVRLLNDGSNDTVQLRKMDAGSESSLTTANVLLTNGTYYVVAVEFVGSRVRVWVDDVQLIDYELQGANTKYMDYDRFGFRLDTAGAPATNARVDSVHAYSCETVIEWRDWQQSADLLHLRIPANGSRRPGANSILRVEGAEALTLLAADTTAGALASDTTAVLEIAAADPVYQTLVALSVAELKHLLGEIDGRGLEAERHAVWKMGYMGRGSGFTRGPQ